VTVVALFIHSGRPDAIDTGRLIATWLHGRGHAVVATDGEADLLGTDAVRPADTDLPDPAVDLVVAIGGDGTMLRATRWAVVADADILGVNLGQLGYLAEIEPGGWEEALAGYFEGGHSVAPRMMVAAGLGGAPAAAPNQHTGARPLPALPLGLNEVVVEKQSLGRTIRLGVSIDGRFFTSYVADGLILATPTGSTAYSLSARGPIVDPSHRAILLTPVSPHSLFDRALVLDPASTVEVAVLGDRPAAVSVDGVQHARLEPGQTVTVTAAAAPARFVTFGARDFHQILKAKFGLSDR
jgi:NAD+ kinase